MSAPYLADEAEAFLRLHDLKKEVSEKVDRQVKTHIAQENLEAMGFEIVTDPCIECMFYVRGGTIPKLSDD